MSKQNTSSKGFAPWRWLKRMFFGASKEYTLAAHHRGRRKRSAVE